MFSEKNYEEYTSHAVSFLSIFANLSYHKIFEYFKCIVLRWLHLSEL